MKRKSNEGKWFFLLLIIFSLLILKSDAQTYVSGGIYSNTTWTKANSPYIVTDSIVIFPGVVFTIQPGVVIKFRPNTRIEVRLSEIIANGNSTDSITFTADSIAYNYGYGSYNPLWLNQPTKATFQYCTFEYAHSGMSPAYVCDSMTILHCTFNSDYIGLLANPFVTLIDSCKFIHDSIAISGGGGCGWGAMDIRNTSIIHNGQGIISPDKTTIEYSIIDSNTSFGIETTYDTVRFCDISGNEVGITGGYACIYGNTIENNDIGILVDSYYNTIYCNTICGNTIYNVKNQVEFSHNINMQHNYWCTTDTAEIDSGIYDGYDFIDLSLVLYNPFDTVPCINPTPPEGIGNISDLKENFVVYPNPCGNSTALEFYSTQEDKISVSVYDIFGRQVVLTTYKVQEGTNKLDINLVKLPEGIYLLKVDGSKFIGAKKITKISGVY